MAELFLSVFSLIWAILIVCLVICGIWVFFSIKKTLTSTLVFDLIYLVTLEVMCLNAMINPADSGDLPCFLITFITFFLNIALTLVILLEWRETPHRMNQYIWWLKIALSISGVYTIIPLGFYYLKLFYLPQHPERKEKPAYSGEVAGFPADSRLPDQFAVQGVPALVTPPAELSDRYTDWHFLGRGGFARVFRVTKKDGTTVALKVPVVHDTATGKTFIAELQNWTRLDQDNIVRVLDFNILPVPFFEMEFCNASLADEKKPVNPRKAAAMVFDICGGLKYCHKKEIIHRDLKPSNILVKDGIIKISDWGLSKILCESNITSSQISFSPQYAAPEQILGTVKDNRTDIWQAGMIFFELVTGTLPFKGENLVEMLANITTRDPPLPSTLVPEAQPLDAIIMKCLRKNPDERYRTIDELQADVTGYLKQEYTALLTRSISANDILSSALCCSHLLVISLKQGDLPGAYRYVSELTNYTGRPKKAVVLDLMKKIQVQINDDPSVVPKDFIQIVQELIDIMQPEVS